MVRPVQLSERFRFKVIGWCWVVIGVLWWIGAQNVRPRIEVVSLAVGSALFLVAGVRRLFFQRPP